MRRPCPGAAGWVGVVSETGRHARGAGYVRHPGRPSNSRCVPESRPRSDRESAVPGQQRPGRHREDAGPAPSRDESRERGEPGPVGWLVPHPASIPAQDRVLVPEHEQLSVLRLVPAEHQGSRAKSPAHEQTGDLEQHRPRCGALHPALAGSRSRPRTGQSRSPGRIAQQATTGSLRPIFVTARPPRASPWPGRGPSMGGHACSSGHRTAGPAWAHDRMRAEAGISTTRAAAMSR
jgi:hypothetical protein